MKKQGHAPESAHPPVLTKPISIRKIIIIEFKIVFRFL